jgi:hypothetical protein
VVRWKGPLALVISIAVGLGILAAILYYVGWQGIVQEILALGWPGFLILGIDFLLTFFFWALTWRIILRSYEIDSPWRTVLRSLLSGYTVSYLTPSMYFGGEPVRVYILSKEIGLPQPRLYATVLVAKLLEAISLVLFALLGVFYALFAGNLPPVQRESLLYGTVFLGFWVVLGVLNFTMNLKLGTRLLQGLRRLLPWKGALSKALEKVAEVEEEIHQAFRSFQLPFTALAFLTSFIANFLIYLRPQIFFYFAQGKVFSFSSLSLLYALSVVLAALFWITPGGIGIAEGGRIGIFALVGVGEAGAVAFSFALKAVELIFVALGISLLMEFGLLRWRKRKG